MLDNNKSVRDTMDTGFDRMQNLDFISHYKPRFLGIGGEHVVFSVDGHDDVVAKVNLEFLGRVFEYGGALDLDSEVDHEMVAFLEQFVLKERERYLKMREYFGEHVLRERVFLQMVPVTREMMRFAHGFDYYFDEMPDEVFYLLGLMRIQRRLPVEALPENGGVLVMCSDYNLSFRIGDEEDAMLFDGVLFDGDVVPDDFDFERILHSSILNYMDSDSDFKELMRGFVENSIRFSYEEGEILDLGGYMNVCAFKRDEKWDYFMPDARFPDAGSFDVGVELLEEFANNGRVSYKDGPYLNAFLDYVRFVNALAIYTGSDARLGAVEGLVVRDLSAKLVKFNDDSNRF